MSVPYIPLSISMTAEYPEEHVLGYSDLPRCSFAPTYKTTIEVLHGEKVNVYEFDSPNGLVTTREPTFREWKMGNKIKRALEEKDERPTFIG